MACRKGALREEGKIRNDAAAAAAALGDALLFATMCIIGMTVEVHAKDGSVFSGIFHTASVDKDYGSFFYFVLDRLICTASDLRFSSSYWLNLLLYFVIFLLFFEFLLIARFKKNA